MSSYKRTPGKAKTDVSQTYATPKTSEVKSFIDQMVSDPNVDLNSIKRKIATKGK